MWRTICIIRRSAYWNLIYFVRLCSRFSMRKKTSPTEPFLQIALDGCCFILSRPYAFAYAFFFLSIFLFFILCPSCTTRCNAVLRMRRQHNTKPMAKMWRQKKKTNIKKHDHLDYNALHIRTSLTTRIKCALLLGNMFLLISIAIVGSLWEISFTLYVYMCVVYMEYG